MNRIGEINYNTFGSKMEIIECRNAKDIDIYFEEYNWIAKHKQYGHFKRGNIKCPYEKRFLGIGYIGEGKYVFKKNKCSDAWSEILRRCYSKEFQEKRPTYTDCIVCEEWHNFQNFAKWYEENYYECNGETIHLDKDILYKNNKIYSPKTCVFVPKRINVLFTKCDKNRGNFPIGVSWCERDSVFRSYCSIYNYEKSKQEYVYLGSYHSANEAFMAYKNFKEKYIKEVADEYKNLIPIELYMALYRYKVEITD